MEFVKAQEIDLDQIIKIEEENFLDPYRKKDFLYECVTNSEQLFEFEYGSYPSSFSSSLNAWLSKSLFSYTLSVVTLRADSTLSDCLIHSNTFTVPITFVLYVSTGLS